MVLGDFGIYCQSRYCELLRAALLAFFCVSEDDHSLITVLQFLRAAFQIQWRNRLLGSESLSFKTSADGVDFSTQEPTPLDRKWHSRKLNGPGLRYEIGVSIASVGIV